MLRYCENYKLARQNVGLQGWTLRAAWSVHPRRTLVGAGTSWNSPARQTGTIQQCILWNPKFFSITGVQLLRGTWQARILSGGERLSGYERLLEWIRYMGRYTVTIINATVVLWSDIWQKLRYVHWIHIVIREKKILHWCWDAVGI